MIPIENIVVTIIVACGLFGSVLFVNKLCDIVEKKNRDRHSVQKGDKK